MTDHACPHPCPWCGGTDTSRIGDAGSLLMTEQWFCAGCSSAFEVIRKRGADAAARSSGGPVVSTGRDGADAGPGHPGHGDDDRPVS